MNREDIELYVMNEYDGDKAALEAALADDAALRAIAAEEAELEMLLRDAGAAATFCVGCGDLARPERPGGSETTTRCDACGAAIRPGGYVVERVLVSNAHGRMYIARDADGTQVALKELAFVQTPSLETIAMFEREAKFLRALEHPAIPRFVASFEEGTGVHARYYLAQELVSGEPLDVRLDGHFYTETEIIDIARQVLDVLVYLQTVSPMVIHRDIKPANLIAKPDGKIAVVDFGAAHVQGTTAGSTSIGTFGYMPIEQLAGQVDATTDAYALGASLLHLLSRREPWRILQQGASLEGINVSPPLRGFLAKLVATEPSQRFANAAAASDALDRVSRGENVVPIERAGRKRGWIQPLLMAAAAVGLVGVGFGVHALMRPDSQLVVTSTTRPMGLVRFELGESMQLLLDGNALGPVLHGAELPVAAGNHAITLVAANGGRCQQAINVDSSTTTVVECRIPGTNGTKRSPQKLPTFDRIPAGKPIDVDFKATPLHDVIRVIGAACGLNFVVPDNIVANLTLKLTQAPCDQALEVLLESHGLWYRYLKAGNVARVAPRNELDREAEAQLARTRAGVVDDALPNATDQLDFDFKDAPLHDLLRVLSVTGGVNLVIPDDNKAKVTVYLKKAPWSVAFTTILEAHGLWYRYRPNGKLLRIAPRVELDREAEAERARNAR